MFVSHVYNTQRTNVVVIVQQQQQMDQTPCELVAKQPAGLQLRGLVILVMVEQYCSTTSGWLWAMVGLIWASGLQWTR